uniref:uncharacterized protein LOC120342332 isoform X2 n=1 Tax=Styela clava TaxID=7725 RepID=UPI00193A7459|nr:uncharacterized protein LOC120342332 isoform X2 [Styela clava]
MRVNTASQGLSHSTASALRALVAHKSMNETALTTAFFCEFVDNWFAVTNCRHMRDTLFVNSEKKLELLSEALHVVKNMKFVATGWKFVAVQSELQLSMTTILRLHQKLVRGKGVQHPKPTQFSVAVKLNFVS